MTNEQHTGKRAGRWKWTGRSLFAGSGAGAVLLVAGAAAALILVSISGSVTSNEFAVPTTTTTLPPTTTTTIPDGDGLQAAISADPGSCDTALATGNLELGAFSFDLNTGTPTPAEKFLCVRNVGPGAITNMTLSFNTSLSGEDGCSAEEGTVDPEGPTCGSDGELDDVLEFALTIQGPHNFGPGTFSCRSPFTVTPGTTESLFSGPELGEGGACAWRIELQYAGSPTNDAKLAASTDTAEFTLDVTGSG